MLISVKYAMSSMHTYGAVRACCCDVLDSCWFSLMSYGSCSNETQCRYCCVAQVLHALPHGTKVHTLVLSCKPISLTRKHAVAVDTVLCNVA